MTCLNTYLKDKTCFRTYVCCKICFRTKICYKTLCETSHSSIAIVITCMYKRLDVSTNQELILVHL